MSAPSSPSPPLRATSVVFVAFWAVLLLAGRTRLFQDPGTFWHIVTGERVLAFGWPREDWLTFSFAGAPWIAHQWLAECAMALLHRLGGLDALLVATSAALAFVGAWLFHRLAGGGLHTRWAVVIASLAMMTASGHFHVRPAVVSVVLFAWLYTRLVDFEAGRIRMLGLTWLLPVFVLWANSHGGALGGLATLGLASLGWILAFAVGWPSPVRSPGQAAALVALVIACFAAPLVGPYGTATVRTWMAIMGSPVLPQMIIEHASIARTGAWHILPLGVAYAGVLLGSRTAMLRPTALLPLVWLVLTFERVRHASLFAVAASLALAEILPGSRVVPWLADRRVQLVGAAAARASRFPRAPLAAVVIALAAVAIVHAGPGASNPVLARIDPTRWPVELIPDLTAAERELPPGSPILNDTLFGGFIEYHTPGLRVFSDDRCELFGDEFILRDAAGDPHWLEDWSSRHAVTVALARRGSPLDRYLKASTEWRQVASSIPAVLYRRDLRDPRSGARPMPASATGAGAPSTPMVY